MKVKLTVRLTVLFNILAILMIVSLVVAASPQGQGNEWMNFLAAGFFCFFAYWVNKLGKVIMNIKKGFDNEDS